MRGSIPSSFFDESNQGFQRRKIERFRSPESGHRTTKEHYETNQDMTDVGIPPFLQNSYLQGTPPPKVTQLRPWQKELLLSDDWKSNKNAIILVPTSGGKTLAADVAFAQQLEQDPESKMIFSLPFVSLASEKALEYRSRFNKFHVRPFYQNVGGMDFRRGNIAVCTFEKVHSLLNSAIRDGYISKFKVIVIDEIHMIGESERGAVIESIIVKLLLLRPHINIRIIGLTATLNVADVKRISTWINGFSYVCSQRPSPIKNYFKASNGDLYILENGVQRQILKLNSIPEDNKHILHPVRTCLSQHPSSTVLVFVNTRKLTVQVALFIARHLFDENNSLPQIQQPSTRLSASRDLLIQRLSKLETGIDPNIGRCIKSGVAFHHAGMLLEERKLIEDAARDSVISIIVATTTLSAGINIRSVSRVIIYDLYRQGNILIPNSVFIQMAGRAGRNELIGGDVFILARTTNEREIQDACALSRNEIENITPQLFMSEKSSDRYFLQCLYLGLLPNVFDFRYQSLA
ncbi:DEAD/DEAH box helicase family protein [Histomonas meleagridis]|uniref:DEAD/DEAH box helicase family protein n=1 Tax=Histomonas meleagridis TaxID=135588 RepID=UPI0035594129|nr:DEAD/DEAH box helicase family protein [Histomonas meleagridis]KAH0801033.1 DEAD/DEAH box helicase family protein [Histomonas meleagridis]